MRSVRARVPFISHCLILLLLAGTVLPMVASASDDWSLDGPLVREDDGRVARQHGSPLDGLVNRVSAYPSDEPGDGSLLLDTVYVYPTRQGPDLDLAGLFATATGRHAVLPGTGTFVTSYGWWSDMDGDGRIADAWDGEDAPGDEFRWRGAASGEDDLSMVFFTIPTTSTNKGRLPVEDRQPSFFYNQSKAQRAGIFEDRTDPAAYPTQSWTLGTGFDSFFLDDSLISYAQTVTVTNARVAPGSNLVVDVLDPEAWIDVDAYETLNEEISVLFHAAYGGTLAIIDPAIDHGIGIVNPILIAAQEYWAGDPLGLGGIVEGSSTTEALNGAWQMVVPAHAKEPNQPSDDYGGRAVSGAGDLRGTGNVYAGYEATWGLWVDMQNAMLIPLPLNVDPGPLGSRTGIYGAVPLAADPTPSKDPEHTGRNAGLIMGFVGTILLWNDLNLDHWVGYVCDPEAPGEWDAENDRCSADPHGWGWGGMDGDAQMEPEAGKPGEWVGVCGATDARAQAVWVEPVGGDWPESALLVRDHKFPTSAVWNPANVLVLEGNEPVDLRLNNCGADGEFDQTRDQLYFPRGNPDVALRTSFTTTLSVFRDLSQGIDIRDQSVTDVDLYPASL